MAVDRPPQGPSDFERILQKAIAEPGWAEFLLHNPRQALIDAGIEPSDARILALAACQGPLRHAYQTFGDGKLIG